jgi:hypothetical protein
MTTIPEVDWLYAAWRRLGVNFSVTPCTDIVEAEPLILATAAVKGADERLTICAVSWLARYHAFVDGRRLSELARDATPTVRSYLGMMLSLAIEAPDGAGRAPQYEAALAHCKPLRRPRALYDNIEALPAFREWARKHGLPVYRRWGFWHDDVTLKLVSVHPLARILKVPELRARALCGPSIEAAFMARTMDRITNARSLSRDIGVSYAAAHAAVERLVGRGLLLRRRNGVRQELSPSALAVDALKAGADPNTVTHFMAGYLSAL